MKSSDLYEMSNFNSRTTGLPTNIVVWARTDPTYHGHDRYRIKITKDNDWAGIFTVSASPKLVKDINNSLTVVEKNLIIEWIKQYASLIIGLIDGKLDSAEFSFEIRKLRG